ncbi:hypothetical protein V8C34DRAFT_265720, partial [Trichoderma compactum]
RQSRLRYTGFLFLFFLPRKTRGRKTSSSEGTIEIILNILAIFAYLPILRHWLYSPPIDYLYLEMHLRLQHMPCLLPASRLCV